MARLPDNGIMALSHWTRVNQKSHLEVKEAKVGPGCWLQSGYVLFYAFGILAHWFPPIRIHCGPGP